MVDPTFLLKLPARKLVEHVVIRLPDGTTKKVTREQIEGPKPQEGGTKT